jgi:hypothetical protein
LKQLLVIVIATCVSLTAFAQAKKNNKGLIGSAVEKADQGYYGMSGCGLGSVLFGETESRGGQILSSTTNGVYSNNTFGMSSGTSNCVPDKSQSTAEMKKNMDMFVAANRESLANDIAKSNGETIVAISNIMGCSDATYLGAKLQSRYETIFNSKEDEAVSGNMWNMVTNDRYLIENCKL